MKTKRKIVEIDDELCDGCGLCVPSCAEGAIQIIDGKARLVAEKYCDGLGACLGECPTGALSVVEREAEEFDERAVEEYLKSRDSKERAQEATLPCGCPSAQVQSFISQLAHQGEREPVSGGATASALSHWPIQIRLVPPTAPFLKGADLLVAADCTPFTYPSFHQDFLKGRVLMVGCPKFDDVRAYIEKFAEIFAGAPIWLLNFTNAALDGFFLKFSVPPTRNKLAGGAESKYWPHIPFGAAMGDGLHGEMA